MQAAEEGGHDSREAVAASDALEQPVLDPHHLYNAGQPGEASSQRERQRLVEGNVDAGIARGVRVETHGADAVANGRAPEEDVDGHGQYYGEDGARVQ